MSFKKGNTYGKGRPVGSQNKITTDIKDKLSAMEDDAIKALQKGIKSSEFRYVKLWFEYRYGKPKENSMVIEFEEQPLFVSFKD